MPPSEASPNRTMAEADADKIQYPVFSFCIGRLGKPMSICAAESLYQLHMEDPSTSRQLGVYVSVFSLVAKNAG